MGDGRGAGGSRLPFAALTLVKSGSLGAYLVSETSTGAPEGTI